MAKPDVLLDRRELLKASGVAVVAATLPWPAQALVGGVATHCACGDWQLDDICSSYPPYSFRIDVPTRHPVPQASTAPSADWHWIG